MLKYSGAILSIVALVVVGCGSKSPAVGTWTMEKESLKAAILSQVPPEMHEQAGPEIDKQVQSMSLEFTMNADGTFTAAGNMGGDKFDAKGTWKLEGDKLSITTTFEDGKEKAEPETKTATLVDGKIKIQEEGMPFEIYLIKK